MSFYKSAEQYYAEMTSAEKEVDTSEHSLIYKSNMPISMELSYNSMLMDELEKKIYAKTALDNKYYDNLIKRCKDMGIERTLGDYASGIVTIKGTKGKTMSKDFMVATKTGKIYKTTTETTIPDEGSVKIFIKAEEIGSSYNSAIGEICSFPVEYKGIDSVINEEEIVNGTDDETYEHLYERYDERMKEVITSGNDNYYKLKAKEIDGVGTVIVHECMDKNFQEKGGNVLVIISNTNRRKADEILITKVSEQLNTNRFVGANINVISIKELEINISCSIETKYEISTIKAAIESALEKYFQEVDDDITQISINKINSIIFSIDQVSDLSDLKINNNKINIDIPEGSVAVLGNVTISEV